MRFCSYLRDGIQHCGFVKDGTVFEIKDRTMEDILLSFDGASVQPSDFSTTEIGSLDDLQLLMPVPEPKKVFCLGYNFGAHAKEMDREKPEQPTLFTRFADSLVAHGQEIWRPRASKTLDWEGELAVVIGKEASHLQPETAMDYVFGYSCLGDHSVREFQKHSTQATAGKNFRKSGSFGPWLVTRDEVADIASLTLTTKVNGTIMQQSSLSDMVFNIKQVLTYITQFTDLQPGDVVAMGTPSGIGMRRNPPIWLKDGDTVEVEVSDIGILSNSVTMEP